MITKIPYWQSTKCSIKKRGIPPKYTHLTEGDIRTIISMYESGGYTYESIARHFNRHPSSIGYVLNGRGYKAIDPSITARKYSIDENYFDKIDSEGKAYFLGFMYADGYNNVSNYEIAVCIQVMDEYILKKFLQELGSNSTVKRYKHYKKGVCREYSKICIGNRRISLNLEKHGCMQRKSIKIIFPLTVPEYLLHHFFRGYFDGDGCFSISKTIKSNMCLSITSNKEFLKGLQKILIDKLSLNLTKICQASNSRKEIGVLYYSGRNSCIKIRDWMYDGATIYLTRKHDKLYSV